MLSEFPSHVQAKVKRILDAEARRLLAEEMNGNALGRSRLAVAAAALPRSDNGALDRGADQLAASVQ